MLGQFPYYLSLVTLVAGSPHQATLELHRESSTNVLNQAFLALQGAKGGSEKLAASQVDLKLTAGQSEASTRILRSGRLHDSRIKAHSLFDGTGGDCTIDGKHRSQKLCQCIDMCKAAKSVAGFPEYWEPEFYPEFQQCGGFKKIQHSKRRACFTKSNNGPTRGCKTSKNKKKAKKLYEPVFWTTWRWGDAEGKFDNGDFVCVFKTPRTTFAKAFSSVPGEWKTIHKAEWIKIRTACITARNCRSTECGAEPDVKSFECNQKGESQGSTPTFTNRGKPKNKCGNRFAKAVEAYDECSKQCKAKVEAEVKAAECDKIEDNRGQFRPLGDFSWFVQQEGSAEHCWTQQTNWEGIHNGIDDPTGTAEKEWKCGVEHWTTKLSPEVTDPFMTPEQKAEYATSRKAKEFRLVVEELASGDIRYRKKPLCKDLEFNTKLPEIVETLNRGIAERTIFLSSINDPSNPVVKAKKEVQQCIDDHKAQPSVIFDYTPLKEMLEPLAESNQELANILATGSITADNLDAVRSALQDSNVQDPDSPTDEEGGDGEDKSGKVRRSKDGRRYISIKDDKLGIWLSDPRHFEIKNGMRLDQDFCRLHLTGTWWRNFTGNDEQSADGDTEFETFVGPGPRRAAEAIAGNADLLRLAH
eukprot:gnl/MRDRNA2_/MRDRNA2_84747_c0_seq7.p1 gnl/MRDRNA2_/MRDRNA2_84747_c0~~gnl/MRDRNA2_/MRDRNA2_84747_c0_seq7.p1  ORF type:complete len:641 (-),score=96.08 gnl/MRDRNA2_/MRDRNA2_84747_c0_seq7:90-2012(-)